MTCSPVFLGKGTARKRHSYNTVIRGDGGVPVKVRVNIPADIIEDNDIESETGDEMDTDQEIDTDDEDETDFDSDTELNSDKHGGHEMADNSFHEINQDEIDQHGPCLDDEIEVDVSDDEIDADSDSEIESDSHGPCLDDEIETDLSHENEADSDDEIEPVFYHHEAEVLGKTLPDPHHGFNDDTYHDIADDPFHEIGHKVDADSFHEVDQDEFDQHGPCLDDEIETHFSHENEADSDDEIEPDVYHHEAEIDIAETLLDPHHGFNDDTQHGTADNEIDSFPDNEIDYSFPEIKSKGSLETEHEFALPTKADSHKTISHVHHETMHETESDNKREADFAKELEPYLLYNGAYYDISHDINPSDEGDLFDTDNNLPDTRNDPRNTDTVTPDIKLDLDLDLKSDLDLVSNPGLDLDADTDQPIMHDTNSETEPQSDTETEPRDQPLYGDKLSSAEGIFISSISPSF